MLLRSIYHIQNTSITTIYKYYYSTSSSPQKPFDSCPDCFCWPATTITTVICIAPGYNVAVRKESGKRIECRLYGFLGNRLQIRGDSHGVSKRTLIVYMESMLQTTKQRHEIYIRSKSYGYFL